MTPEHVEEMRAIRDEVDILIARAVRDLLKKDPSAAVVKAAMDWRNSEQGGTGGNAVSAAIEQLREARAAGGKLHLVNNEDDDRATPGYK